MNKVIKSLSNEAEFCLDFDKVGNATPWIIDVRTPDNIEDMLLACVNKPTLNELKYFPINNTYALFTNEDNIPDRLKNILNLANSFSDKKEKIQEGTHFAK
nr:hypothetical protein [Providencia rettgeri]